MKPKLILKICTAILSFIITILAAELILLSIGYKREKIDWGWAVGLDNPQFIPDKNLIYRPQPDIPEFTDHLSFRQNIRQSFNRDYATTEQIIALGDSFTYGGGVESADSYPARLEKIINANQSRKIKTVVHNAGVPGYSFDQEFVFFKQVILPQARVDKLIWNININDIYDSNYACLFKPANGDFTQVKGSNNLLYWRGIFLRSMPTALHNSRLLSFIFAKLPVRHTIGCTLPEIDVADEENLYRKLTFLLQEMKLLSQNYHFTLYAIIVPFQDYFTKTSNTAPWSFKIYTKLLSAVRLAGIEPIDTNAIIWRTKQANETPPKNMEISVILGSKEEDLSYKLFRDETSEGFSYGNWHLNPEGNYLLANIIFESL